MFSLKAIYPDNLLPFSQYLGRHAASKDGQKLKTADNEQQQAAPQQESAAKEPAQDIDDEDDAGDDEDISDMPSTSSGFAFSQPERCPTCQDLVVVNFKRHVRRCYECELCHRYFTFPSHKANCAKQLAEQEANRGKKDYSDCPICKKVVKFVATHIRLVHKQDPAIFSGRRSRGTQEQRAEASKVQKDYGRKVTKAYCYHVYVKNVFAICYFLRHVRYTVGN